MRTGIAIVMSALAGLLAAQEPDEPGPRPVAHGPDRPQRADLLVDLRRAAQALASGNHAGAEAMLRSLSQRAPDLASVWYQLAMAQRCQGKDTEALVAVERALAAAPTLTEARLLQAELQVVLDPAKAKVTIGELLRDPLAPGYHRQLVPMLVTLRLTEEAEAVFVALLQATPRDVELLRLRARCLLDRQQPAEAAAVLAQLVAVEPKDPQALETMAQAWLAAGERGKARAAWEQTLQVNPSNLAVRKRLLAALIEERAEAATIDEQKRLVAHWQTQVDRWQKQGAVRPPPNGPAGSQPPR
ncbi:MAG: tetratricopeptide repeat protein [Planctomycetes bacterium]|nr:tetratricopeptide repeat protein [Planctomycetota bacterium]